MRKNAARKLALEIAALSVLAAGLAAAAPLKQKSGQVVDGKPVRVIPAQVEMQISAGKVTMPLDSFTLESQAVILGRPTIEAQVEELEKQLAEIKELSTKQQELIDLLKSQAPQKTGGIKIQDFGSSIVRVSGNYVTYGWKVDVLNGTDSIKQLNVYFEGVDENKIPLSTSVEYRVLIKPGEVKTVTGQKMAEVQSFDRIKTWIARTEAP